MKHGKGTEVFKNNDKYVGEYKNDLKDGHGKFFNQVGIYEGSYKNGRKHGHGKMIFHREIHTKDAQGWLYARERGLRIC